MKSKERIRPVNPKDVSNLIREGKATSQFEPGTVVRRTAGSDNDLVEKVDTTGLNGNGNTTDVTAAPELVWTDMTTRFDAQQRPEYDKDADAGSRVNQYYKVTTLPQDFLADIEIANVIDGSSPTPTGGDQIIKSTNTAGKMEVVQDVSTFLSNHSDLNSEDFERMRLGTVQADSDTSGFVRVQFTLG